MKSGLLYILLFLIATSPVCIAQAEDPIADADKFFMEARKTAFSGAYVPARDALSKLIAAYPQYIDAQILMAKTYSWENNFDEARKILNTVTSTERGYKDAWTAAINNEIYSENYNIALGLLNKCLNYLESDKELEDLKETIHAHIKGQYKKRTKTKEGEDSAEQIRAISLNSSGEFFDRGYEAMYYTTIAYKHSTAIGLVMPKINYSQRFGIQAIQYELDAYPRFTNTIYAYLNYAFSDAPINPEHRSALELYLDLPNASEVSLGARYLGFENDRAFLLTGSYGFYKGNTYLSARPYISLRNMGRTGFSGTFLARKYIKDANNYIGLTIGYGFDSELDQFIIDGTLLSIDQLFIETQSVRLEYQFRDKKKVNTYQTYLGVRRQELPFDPGTFAFSIRLGLQYQVNF